MEKRFLKNIIEKKKFDSSFKLLKNAVKLGKDKCLKEIEKSELKGRGGAGFSTAKKWGFVKDNNDVILICNADEGEPGTFKDRYIMENNPEYLLESILLSSFVINAQISFIYIRGEYKDSIKKLSNVIKSNKKIINWFSSEIIPNYRIEMVIGAGAYICGDETSLINSIEGKRPSSRIKPPFPAEHSWFP